MKAARPVASRSVSPESVVSPPAASPLESVKSNCSAAMALGRITSQEMSRGPILAESAGLSVRMVSGSPSTDGVDKGAGPLAGSVRAIDAEQLAAAPRQIAQELSVAGPLHEAGGVAGMRRGIVVEIAGIGGEAVVAENSVGRRAVGDVRPFANGLGDVHQPGRVLAADLDLAGGRACVEVNLLSQDIAVDQTMHLIVGGLGGDGDVGKRAEPGVGHGVVVACRGQGAPTGSGEMRWACRHFPRPRARSSWRPSRRRASRRSECRRSWPSGPAFGDADERTGDEGVRRGRIVGVAEFPRPGRIVEIPRCEQIEAVADHFGVVAEQWGGCWAGADWSPSPRGRRAA